MSTTSSKSTMEQFNRVFSAYRILHVVVTDIGPQFKAQELIDFMTYNEIVHMKSALYFPATNGLAGRNVQTFKAALRRETPVGISVETALQTF